MARALVALPFIARRGMRITFMRGGRSVVDMPLGPANAGDDGTVHEGAVAALLDTRRDGGVVAGGSGSSKASTVGIHVSYLAPAREEDVVAHGRTLRRSNEIFLNTVTVSGRTSGRVIATGSVTYRIVVPG